MHAFARLFHPGAVEIPLSLVVAGVVIVLLAREWWRVGRDHWYGDSGPVTGTETEGTKPLLEHETIVVEYKPPILPGAMRPLRPAEVGLLLDERVDNVDVTATVVDLAVRKYIRIRELLAHPLLRRKDYALERLQELDATLLEYEKNLLKGLFGEERTVRMSELRGQFSEHYSAVRYEVYQEPVHAGLFHQDPDLVRENYRFVGAGIAAAGVAATAVLAATLGAGLVGLPVAFGGLILLGVASIMPRRTALGHQIYRQCLGFREYVTTAEIDRQRFAEERDLFENYLPYAMVFGCTKKWAGAFHDLESWDPHADWYFGRTGLLPLDIAIGVGELVAGLAEGRKERAQAPA